MSPRRALAAASALLAPAAAHGQALIDQCGAETCKARLTADELIAEIQRLLALKRFDDARPMIEALALVPEKRLETRFLAGQMAAGAGRHAEAAQAFRAILDDDPSQTRVRLELGRELLALGKYQTADKHFRLALADKDVPPDIARTIRKVRDVIRSKRGWHLDVDFGLAPDTNINNATSAETVSVLWGDVRLPLTLDKDARAKSGLGQTASVSAGVKLPVGEKVAILADLDTAGTNYSGSKFDDYLVQVAAGPQIRLNRATSASLEAVGAQRWYGGKAVSRQVGAKANLQSRLNDRAQLGVLVDARWTDAAFDDHYDGWQLGGYVTYERVVAKSLVASGGAFVRRDSLKAPAYSSTEVGVIAGIGGQLPLGINFAVSGSASRAVFDAPMPLFDLDPRKDWRFTGRATLGTRKIRLFGFSPELGVSYSRFDSSMSYYSNDRLRFRIALARYF